MKQQLHVQLTHTYEVIEGAYLWIDDDEVLGVLIGDLALEEVLTKWQANKPEARSFRITPSAVVVAISSAHLAPPTVEVFENADDAGRHEGWDFAYVALTLGIPWMFEITPDDPASE